MENNLLVWADTETTGTETGSHLLELAFVITDERLEQVGDSFEVVVFQPDEHLADMNDVVREMHERSGLTEEVKASTVDVKTAERMALEFVQQYFPEPIRSPENGMLCGSSVWFDRNQFKAWMPELDAHFYHRMIDVSAVKELARRWCPVAFAGLAAGMANGVKAHRALPDVLNSIYELAYYHDTVFKRI